MRVVLLILVGATIAHSQTSLANESLLIRPYCRCCDWHQEQIAVDRLITFARTYPCCSPIIHCLNRCLYDYHYSWEIQYDGYCSISTKVLIKFYEWLLYSYQCLPHSLLVCVKRCAVSFEKYPSCYWTINAEIGVDTSILT